jgi:protein-S-isoprenylcysteine O-methyltransferase Ste14
MAAPSAVTVAVVVVGHVLTAALCIRAMSPPALPASPYARDRISCLAGGIGRPERRAVFVVVWAWHGLVSLTQPATPALLCPRASQVSPWVMGGSAFSAACLALLVAGSVLRLRTYAALGTDFTFLLAQPRTLVTDGVYHYVRHPSYTGLFVLSVVNVVYLLNRHAVLACWLPLSWVRGGGPAVDVLWAAAVAGLVGWTIAIRVRDEEEMMGRTFGATWEAYAKRTKRYVPLLF